MRMDSKKCDKALIKSPAWVALIWLGMTAGISLLISMEPFSAFMQVRPIAPDTKGSILTALNKAEFVVQLFY